MSLDTIIAPRCRWSPRKFARALLENKTQAEAAKIAGSTAVTDEALAQVGYRWRRHPKVQRWLSVVDDDLQRAWRGFVSHAADVCEGLVPDATEIDRLGNGLAAGRALGKFVQRIDITHSGVISYSRLAPSDSVDKSSIIEASLMRPKAVPALPASTSSLSDADLLAQLEAIKSELARRQAVPATAPKDAP